MKRLLVLVVLVSTAAFVGCSSVSVKHDFAPEVDFSKFKTYDWIDPPADMKMSAEEARVRNSLLDKRIKSAVNDVMAAKGLELVESDPTSSSSIMSVFRTRWRSPTGAIAIIRIITTAAGPAGIFR